MGILRHSTDLFRDCRLHLNLYRGLSIGMMDGPGEFLSYLKLLQFAKPFSIKINRTADESPELLPDKLLRESVMLNCHRLSLNQVQHRFGRAWAVFDKNPDPVSALELELNFQRFGTKISERPKPESKQSFFANWARAENSYFWTLIDLLEDWNIV